MNVEWIWGLLGGLIIGSAGALYLLGNGRVMGASGILGGLFDRATRDARRERIAFLAGLVGVPAVVSLVWSKPLDTYLTSNIGLVILAGLCVGFGTRLGNGCTSGHGVCGISRLSIRGIVATCVYIGAGVITVVVLRKMMGVG